MDECFDGLIKSGVFQNMTNYRAAPINDLGALADYQKEHDNGESSGWTHRRSFNIVVEEEDGILWLVGFHCDK